jgi:hypothetical protein
MSTHVPSTQSVKGSSRALWGGVAFSVAFTLLIVVLRPLMPQIDFAPDTGYAHYYWKLPEPTFWSRATAWGGYMMHQVAIWGTIYYAQKSKLKYTNGLHKVNIVALGLSAFFVLLHLLQTSIWYDGLAQDVHIGTSQGSVILLLVMVLLMENQRRGLFFGKKINFLKESGQVARKYHGYIFSWAVIYTFWYHPMEATGGHLLGTFYTLLLMLQGALMFTRMHVNKYWTTALEVLVLVHGTLVAIAQGNGMWTMFFFGFAALFVVTQMYGLGLSRRWQWAFIGAYIAGTIIVYSQTGWGNLNEIIRIPVIEYGLVFVLALIIWAGLRLSALVGRWFRPQQRMSDRRLSAGD